MVERPTSQWVKRDRRPASVTGVAYRSDGAWVRVHMTNLSYDGCHLLTDRKFEFGECLTLVMPQMRHLKVQVRWAREGHAGVRFVSDDVQAERRARIGI